jgi:hypothetical protein
MLDDWEFTVLLSLWVEIWGLNLNFMQALIYIDSEMQTGNLLNTSQNGYCLSQLAPFVSKKLHQILHCSGNLRYNFCYLFFLWFI